MQLYFMMVVYGGNAFWAAGDLLLQYYERPPRNTEWRMKSSAKQKKTLDPDFRAYTGAFILPSRMKIETSVSNVLNVTALIHPRVLYAGIDMANRWHSRVESKVSHNNNWGDGGGGRNIEPLNGGGVVDSGGLWGR